MSDKYLAKFSDLSLGVRFHYIEGRETFKAKTFVKIWPDKVAEWDDSKIAERWVGQSICLACDDGNLDFEVEVVG